MIVRTSIVVAALIAVGAPRAAGQELDDDPARRWAFFHMRRAYPLEGIPPGALQRARAQFASRVGVLRPAAPPVQGFRWQPLGPQGIPINGSAIGRISTIAVDAANANVIYVGGAQGGVWKSMDGGSSWIPLSDHECSLAMGWIALDPVNPSIIYAGTGEQHFSGDSYYGCGLLRSTDAGATWTRLGASVFSTSTGGARISRVAIAPSTAGAPGSVRLLVASDFGLFRSTDGGATWSERLVGQLDCVAQRLLCAVTDLVLDPLDDSVAYAAVRTQGVYRTVDAGLTWTPTGGLGTAQAVGRINLALARSAAGTLYAALEDGNTGSLLGFSRTMDAGRTWTFLGTGDAGCNRQCWYDMAIAVDPRDANVVYFGGVSLYRSTDAGRSFQSILNGIHVDQHVLTFDPQDPATLYVGNDGGIYRSRNAGASWTSLNRGLELTQFYEGISLHPSDRIIVMGGTQDNGTLTSTGSSDWTHVLGGDGGYTAIDPDEPWVRYAETQWRGGPRRSDGGPFVSKVNGINMGEGALFIPPLVMSPTDPRTLYFGATRLYRTRDRGELWTPLDGDGAGAGPITAIAPAAANPDVLYVAWLGAYGTDGGVYVTTDAGATWVHRAGGPPETGGVPDRFVTDIAVDRVDWRTAYVTASGFGAGHVFRTTDAGVTWRDVSGPLPDVPVNAVVLDPANRGFVMIGTDLGVFVSPDSGGTWTVLDQGLPNVAVLDLAYNPATAMLVAATHGRGMFALQLDRPLTLAVVPARRADTVLVGATVLRPDSVDVLLTGVGAATAGWSATHTGAEWLTLTTAGGTSRGRMRWTRNPAGLTAGRYVDTITISAAGAEDSPTLVFDTLLVVAPLTVALEPGTRRDTVPAGSLTPVSADSASVVITGWGGESAGWSATVRSGSWLTVTTAGGTGPGVLRWCRDASVLPPGVHVGIIAVAVTGAQGSPATIVDSLVITSAPVYARPATHADTIRVGQSAGRPDSAFVTLTTPGSDTTSWTARSARGTWLRLGNTGGTGSGYLRWTRDATALSIGRYVDTVRILTSRGDAARLVDVLVVRPLPVALEPAGFVDTAVSGSPVFGMGSARVVLEGGADTVTTWRVTHGTARWMTLRTVSGRGAGTVEWLVRTDDVPPGAYADTLVVATARADTARLAVRLVATAPPVTRECAVAALFGGACLDEATERYLDLVGNGDGRYDLGDLVALLHRVGGGQ